MSFVRFYIKSLLAWQWDLLLLETWRIRVETLFLPCLSSGYYCTHVSRSLLADLSLATNSDLIYAHLILAPNSFSGYHRPTLQYFLDIQ